MKEHKLGRNKVQPIRDEKDLENCFVFLRREITSVDGQRHPTQKWIVTRNYYLILLGVNIGLRVTDLLRIKAGMIQSGFIQLREQKTGKLQQITVNQDILNEIIRNYIKKFDMDDDAYLFSSRKGYNEPMTRQNVSAIIKNIAKALRWNFPVNTHTMRKTFGYHYYKRTKDAVSLQQMFNHRDERTTRVYIGITQEALEDSRKAFKLNY